MSKPDRKQLASPALTGGLGLHFEEDVQTSFAALMLTGGFSPGLLVTWPIVKIKLQGRHADYDTDDLIVFVREAGSDRERKLLGQVKHSLSLTARDTKYGEVLHAAWRDFNNKRLFRKGRGGDVIALITGPLSGVDTESIRPMLDRVRQVEDSDEFFRDIALGRFTSTATRKKLDAIRFHLKEANKGVELSDKELFEFLQHFHLLIFDLDIKAGVNIALLHTVVANHTGRDAAALWARLLVEVRTVNQTAGTMTKDSFPVDLLEQFERETPTSMPLDLRRVSHAPAVISNDWATDPHASSLAKACLLGEWIENNERDRELISTLVSPDFEGWLNDLRVVLQRSDSPIRLKNGHWKVKDRMELWNAMRNLIFDSDLDAIKEIAVEALSEVDPKMDLPAGDRAFSIIDDDAPRASNALRSGLSGTLAFLGNEGQRLEHCTHQKPQLVAVLAIRRIFGPDGSETQP